MVLNKEKIPLKLYPPNRLAERSSNIQKSNSTLKKYYILVGVNPIAAHSSLMLSRSVRVNALEICYPLVSNILEATQILMIFLLTDLQWAAV